jgi:ribosome biogenesis GTPase
MSNRKLSKNQLRRIAENQQKELSNVNEVVPIDISNCNGRIISHFGQQLDVEILKGAAAGSILRCHQRANLPHLVTGDLVQWVADTQETGVIVAQSNRKNIFGRHDPTGRFKPIAANLSCVLIVIAVVPEAFLNLIDRYLVAVERLDLLPLLVLNKIDLIENKENPKLEALLSIYRNLGYQVFEVSAKTTNGIQSLEKALADQTTILVGQSGVGKSSLINRLGLDKLTQTGELSAAKYKGTHTTTTARLYHMGKFDLIDSPGIREFGLSHITAQEILKGFKELNELALLCKFRDCGHDKEAGCGIQQGISTGIIAPERLDSYRRIINSLH